MLKRLALLSLVAGLALPVLTLRPVEGQDQDNLGDKVRALLQEGTDLYKRGKYQEASAKFEEAFQLRPSSDQVYAYIKRAGDDIVAGMMNSPDRKMQDIGRRLFELAKPGEPYRPGDKATILKYVEELKSDDHVIWRNAFWHLKNFGPWCVRFVLPALGDQQQDRFRARAMLLLTEMGDDASLAAIEAMDSADPFLRTNAAIVLGNIKDERAIAVLKRAVEDANEPANVKKYADEALRKIIRIKEATQWRKATDYYYELAMKYYYSHSSVIHVWQRAYLVWKWERDDARRIDRLTERKVPRFAFNEQLAEEALYDLLSLDDSYADKATGYSAWSLLACVHFAQAIEARAAIDAAVEALKRGELDKLGLVKLMKETEGIIKEETAKAAFADAIEKAANDLDVQAVVTKYLEKQAKVIRANVLGELPGKRFLYEALARSLADGNYLVAKSCIETIEEMGRPEDLPAPATAPGANGETSAQAPPTAGTGSAQAVDGTVGYSLVEALTNEDKRVRYAAAKAMVRINPQRRKLGMELVIPNLIDAIGEMGVRVVLVIYDVQDDADRNFMNGFRKTLTSINAFPIIVTNGAEGIVKAKAFPTQDVIIIQKKICGQVYFKEADTKKPIVETVFDTLRDDVRTKNIPRIVLGDNQPEVDAANKEFVEKGTAFAAIGRDVHKLDLRALFEKAFDLPEAKKDSKDRADEIAKNAAEALASIDPTNTLYPYRDAVQALITTVGGQVIDGVDATRQDFIRIPAARALGHFGDAHAVDVLSKVLDTKDPDADKAARQKGVRLACGKALSDVFRQTGANVSGEVFDALKRNLKDGDYDLEMATGEAVGNAKLTNAQRLDLSKHRRLERETYNQDDP